MNFENYGSEAFIYSDDALNPQELHLSTKLTNGCQKRSESCCTGVSRFGEAKSPVSLLDSHNPFGANQIHFHSFKED